MHGRKSVTNVNDVHEIIVCGSGNSVSYIPDDLLNTVPVMCFSNFAMKWMADKDAAPDFWSFLDPNSALILNKLIKTKEDSNSTWKSKLSVTTMIHHNFQGNATFYDKYKLTCRHGKNWVSNTFPTAVLSDLVSTFGKTIVLNPQVHQDGLDLNTHDPNWSIENCPFVQHSNRSINSDKFTTVVLPMCLSVFPNLKRIYVAGFGDFTIPRYDGDSQGYSSYRKSIDLLVHSTMNIIKEKGISLVFFNDRSYLYTTLNPLDKGDSKHLSIYTESDALNARRVNEKNRQHNRMKLKADFVMKRLSR